MTLAPPAPNAPFAPGSAGIVECQGVVKRFGDTIALSNVSVSVPRGVTGLLGSNGAGKTTLMGLILGLTPRDGGSMSVLGADPLNSGPEIRARIGYSPEHHHLPEDVQAADLVRHLAQLHGLPKQASTERASDALWQVGLGEERFRPVGTMSTGQRQRVKLAAAIAHDPDLVLLDEPTDGLDPVQRDDMLELIQRIGGEFGIDILLSSHLLDEVERICDSVIILAGGVVTRSATLAELRGDVTGLIIEVDDDGEGRDRLQSALAAQGCTIQQQERRFVVSGDIDIHRVVRDALADSGLGLRHLEAKRRNLQDVYLDANSPGVPIATMTVPPGQPGYAPAPAQQTPSAHQPPPPSPHAQPGLPAPPAPPAPPPPPPPSSPASAPPASPEGGAA